jgi:multidrug transporter EmrE-like cation transporter
MCENMPMSAIILILVSVTISAIAQIALKLGLSSQGEVAADPDAGIVAMLMTPAVMIGLALYGGGALLWLTALARVELSQAYPFVGVGFALTTFAGWWLFGDHITLQRITGIVVITCGILLVARS